MTRDDLDAELTALEAHPKADLFANAIADDVRTLRKAMSRHGAVTEADRYVPVFIDARAEREAKQARAERRAKLRAQIDGAISAGDIDYLASRAGERRRRGQALGQTQHMLDGARGGK